MWVKQRFQIENIDSLSLLMCETPDLFIGLNLKGTQSHPDLVRLGALTLKNQG